MKIKKILIVADDSEASVKAFRYGLDLAAGLKAKVLLISVIEPARVLGNPDAGMFPDDALIDQKAKTMQFLTRLKKENQLSGDMELAVLIGDMLTTIIETATKWEAGLIIAGTHNRSDLSKLFNGNTAGSIIQYSPVPVLVVPAGK